MANRIDSLMAGVGAPNEVAKFLMDQKDSLPVERAAIGAVFEQMRGLLMMDGMESDLMSLCCAFMNRRFEETGILFRVDARGLPNFTYFASGSERTIVAGLLAG